MTRIAVDAMGGDRAPVEIVHGAVAAASEGVDVVLVGDEVRLGSLLAEMGSDLPIHHASEIIGMDDDPATALRVKKDSSISVAARLVAGGECGGLVSAGSTGAAMAAAALIVGRLTHVARPAIATLLPGSKVVLDSGANLVTRPEHLVQFAIMGSALSSTLFHIERPRVGLLNIGEEPGKGRDTEKEAYRLLGSVSGIDFVGNVEGRDLATDAADVFVTDGFTGNVLLKTAEGTARMVEHALLEALDQPELREAVGAITPALLELRRRLDPETIGGAHLLGVDGVVVIAHGSSSRVAIANAVTMAAAGASDGLPVKIASGLAAAAAAR